MNNDNDVIEILDDINQDDNVVSVNNTPVNDTPVTDTIENQPKGEEVIKSDKQEIKIEDEDVSDNSKSGLTFVIVLFILLIAFIIGLPYISKLIP